MPDINIIKEVKLQKNNCQNKEIKLGACYLVNYGGNWILGQFNKQWYGWNFNWFGTTYAGLQLNALSRVYEIESGY